MAKEPKRLAEQLRAAHLPANPDNRARLQAIAARPGLSGGQIARVAVDDPAFCAALVQAYHQRTAASADARAESGDRGPTGIAHLVSLLGVGTALDILRQAPVLEDLKAPERIGYLRASARALFAAHCAREWGHRSHDPAPHELHLATLARSFPELALWTVAPAQAQALESALAARLGSPEQCAERVLAQRWDDLAAPLATSWGVPGLARATLTTLDPEALARRAVDPSERREVTVALSDRLTLTGTLGWDHEHVAQTIHSAAQLSRVSESALAGWLHSQAAVVARTIPCAHAFSPAAALLLPPADILPPPRREPARKPPAAPAPKPAPKPATPSARSRSTPNPAPATTDSAEIAPAHALEPPAVRAAASAVPAPQAPPPVATSTGEHCARLLRQFLAHEIGAGELLMKFTEAAATDLELDRSILSLVSPDATALLPRFFFPEHASELRGSLTFKLNQRHLFAKLMAQPAAVWVHPGAEKYRPLVPASLYVATGTEAFFAASIFSDTRPVGLLYADAHGSDRLGQASAANLFAAFRKRTQMLSKALARAREGLKQAS